MTVRTCLFRGGIRFVSLVCAVFSLWPSSIHAQPCSSLNDPPCDEPLVICPIPLLRVHVDFPVNYTAFNNWQKCPGTKTWATLDGPPEFSLDSAGGLFSWTPSTIPFPDGIENIRIRVRNVNGEVVDEAITTFQALVDNNTITNPVWRDYLSDPATVSITGRATDAPNGAAFQSYSLEFARVQFSDNPPADEDWVRIGDVSTTPVMETGSLGTWDISAEPDGGRYYLRLVVNLDDGSQSIVENQVIIDRSASSGWPKRVDPISHSPVLADINDDGRSEVIVVTFTGILFVWDIEGILLWSRDVGGVTYSAPSIGDIDGDGRPEILWTSSSGPSRLFAYHADGTPVAGFPVPGPLGRPLRTVPTLADLDGDGVLDILVGAQGSPVTDAQVLAYRYDVNSEAVALLAGWPQTVPGLYLYASASVADINGDQIPDVIIESNNFQSGMSKAFAFDANGNSLAGWVGGVVLDAAIDGATTNAGGSSRSTSQTAIADLDGDGNLEIIIGSNILRADGTQIFADTDAVNSLSAAVANLDGDPTTLEVVLGNSGWRWDPAAESFVSFEPFPLVPVSFRKSLASAIVGDCGEGHRDVIFGGRSSTNPPPGVFAFHVVGDDAGEFFEGYPKSLFGPTADASAPVIGDFNQDGRVQVAAAITDASYGGVVGVWDMPGDNHDEHHDWPMLGHNIRHTGFYIDPPPNRPGKIEVTYDPSSMTLHWEDRSAVEDGYSIERSMTGAPWSFVPIATLAPDSVAYSISGSMNAFYRVRAVRYDSRTGAAILSRFASANTVAIPAVSEWGIVVLIICLCALGTLILRARRRAEKFHH